MVRAVFQRFVNQSLSSGRIVRCMLIIDVRDTQNKVLTPHMWLQLKANEVITVPLKRGDIIQFSALVSRYAKGNTKRPTFDFGLIRPRDIQVIQQEETVKEQKEINKRPAWEVIKGLRPVTPPVAKQEPWPRLFKVEYDLSNLKVRGASVEAQLMRKQKQTLYGTHYPEPFGMVTLADGRVFESLSEMQNLIGLQGKHTITWQDEEQE